MKKCLMAVMSIAAAVSTVAAAPVVTANTGTSVTIIIEPFFGNLPLKLSDQAYVNDRGDTLYIDLFKFYITNFRLQGSTAHAEDANSHLVDAEQEATLSFAVQQLEPGIYNSLHLVLGVDSIANTSGANGGDLDVTKGMYWAWNSGYIMAKVEGHAAVCKTFHHAFEFHIGGYMPPYNAARNVEIKFQHPIEVKPGSGQVIRLRADVSKWFGNGLDLAKVNSIMIPGSTATQMADNYATMLSVAEENKQ